ncbi:hypothetical protein HJC23_002889 [Cyclotella cryptica]|uniref:Uncharacterized protein n=1 Tax=Cyclotella cryptica TaxID=29204 RepID=A0ABD3PJU3_9STRA|eukprot:CCRYP_014114-RA/>CCRYP_014114-RA protein AED:0.24 eAED:0.24 QI:0/-1/0/1/-1/1/1/0/280
MAPTPTMLPRQLLTVFLSITAIYILPSSHGFSVEPSKLYGTCRSNVARITPIITSCRVLPESVEAGGPVAAQSYFFLWFFGGSGGAGVALRQFPQQFEKFKSLRGMSGDGPTAGGDTIGVSPLCLYPRDLSKMDVEKVLSNKLSVEDMIKRGPKPNYLSEKGYLCYESFVEANSGCNPLTIRAVFDAMSTGDIVAPDVAQMKLNSFVSDRSSDFSVFKSELLRTKLVGFSSIAFLLFLLGPIVGSTCLEALAKGWFPEWPGNENLPWSLLSPWTIPDYWV